MSVLIRRIAKKNIFRFFRKKIFTVFSKKSFKRKSKKIRLFLAQKGVKMTLRSAMFLTSLPPTLHICELFHIFAHYISLLPCSMVWSARYEIKLCFIGQSSIYLARICLQIGLIFFDFFDFSFFEKGYFCRFFEKKYFGKNKMSSRVCIQHEDYRIFKLFLWRIFLHALIFHISL